MWDVAGIAHMHPRHTYIKHALLAVVIRILNAEPRMAGPTYFVVCALLPEVLYTLVHWPPLETCSSNAYTVEHDEITFSLNLRWFAIHLCTTSLGWMLPINCDGFHGLHGTKIQLHIDWTCGVISRGPIRLGIGIRNAFHSVLCT